MDDNLAITDIIFEEGGVKGNLKNPILNPGLNIKFFRTKKGATIVEMVDAVNTSLANIKLEDLSPEFQKEYKELVNTPVTIDSFEGWEMGNPVPGIIIYFAANFLNLGIEWLTDHTFDIFEGNDFVQYGGVSYNNWKNINSLTINHPTKELSEAYFNYADRIERIFKELMQNMKNDN